MQRGNRRRRLRVAGLFAGVGGLEYGLHVAGHATALLCENDPAAAAVLAARFPKAKLHDDVRTLLPRALPARLDVLTAGFPCQDLSQVGRTAGIEGAKSSLVRHVFRLLRERRVPWVVLENVPFMLHLDRGRAMGHVVDALEDLGYRWAYRVVDAMAFGLPQRRRRVFVVASLAADPGEVLFADDVAPPPESPWTVAAPVGFYWTEGNRGVGWATAAVPTLKGGSGLGIPSPPAVLLPDGRLLTPSLAGAERLQGLPAGWTRGEGGRVDRLRWRMVGNAVNVRVAAWLAWSRRSPGHASASATHWRRVRGGRKPRTARPARGRWCTSGTGRFGGASSRSSASCAIRARCRCGRRLDS
jgi:DNA (cytosine-5)-methyltransferase 1